MDRKPLILKMPPSVNHMYITLKNNKKILTSKARLWQDESIIITKQWIIENSWITQDNKTILNIWFYYPDARKRDSHNSLKILMDMLEIAGIYKNDRYGIPRIMDFEIDRNNPRIEIEFEL